MHVFGINVQVQPDHGILAVIPLASQVVFFRKTTDSILNPGVEPQIVKLDAGAAGERGHVSSSP